MPPENWCGQESNTRSGPAMPMRPSNEAARVRAASGVKRSCAVIVSINWREIRSTGFSEVIGSWNTIAISAPRISRSSSSDSAVISLPRKRIDPATMRAGSSSRFMIDLAATLLPDPDSPTIPSVSPRFSVKLTPSTARTTPASVKNQVRRSLTCSNGSAPVGISTLGISASSRMRVEPIAKTVADEVEADHHRQDRQAREGRHPPLRDQLATLGDHGPPFRRRRHHAEPQERQPGEHQDGVAKVQRNQHDQWPER